MPRQVNLTKHESVIDHAVYAFVKETTGKQSASDITEQDIWRGYTHFIQHIASICFMNIKMELNFLELNMTSDLQRALYIHRLRAKVLGERANAPAV